MSGLRTEALARTLARAGRAARGAEPCALCAAALPDDHLHMLDTATGFPICVCVPCSLLFEDPAAGPGRFRPIRARRRRLEGFSTATFGVPVGLCFIVVKEAGDVVAHYPSPAGPTRWDVDPADWAAALEGCPELAQVEPEVEAVLSNRARGRSEAWIVPVSDCYRLVATVRENWEGLSGGARVWMAVEELFDELRRTDGTYPHR